MEHLEPRSSCCLDLLCTKIGSNLIVCKKCDNEWEYKGKNPYYATCSRCLNKVKVNPEKVSE